MSDIHDPRSARELQIGAADPEVDDDAVSPGPLPGSIYLAEKIERRKFLRRMSKSLFFGAVAVSSGTTTLFGFLADPAHATGACCNYSCCGPSLCCSTSCCSKNCCSPAGSDNCTNNGSTCLGYSGTWSGLNCWSCVLSGSCRTVTCCDCKTNNQTGCPNPNGVNRCICDQVFPYCVPFQRTQGHIRAQLVGNQILLQPL